MRALILFQTQRISTEKSPFFLMIVCRKYSVSSRRSQCPCLFLPRSFCRLPYRCVLHDYIWCHCAVIHCAVFVQIRQVRVFSLFPSSSFLERKKSRKIEWMSFVPICFQLRWKRCSSCFFRATNHSSHATLWREHLEQPVEVVLGPDFPPN